MLKILGGERMKKLSIIFAVMFALALMVPQAYAANALTYETDFGPAGTPGDPKDYDENTPPDVVATTGNAAETVAPNGPTTVDVWVQQTEPENMASVGFFMNYVGADTVITSIQVYNGDGSGTGALYTSLPGDGWDTVLVTDTGSTVRVSLNSVAPAGIGNDVDGAIKVARLTLTDGTGGGIASLTFTAVGPTFNVGKVSGSLDSVTADHIVSIEAECECITDADCQDGAWCTGLETCSACECIPGAAPCADTSCIEEVCTEAGTPSETAPGDCALATCKGVTGPSDPCCEIVPCDDDPVCGGVGIIVEPGWIYGDVGIKVDICLDNQIFEVGGMQLEICDVPNCIECIGCELSERTVLFDCFVSDDGECCTVILLSKNPGGVINPGLCKIVRIDYQMNGNEDCDGCIEIGGAAVVGDPYGRPIPGTVTPGEICPFTCGDVHPADSAPDAGDCGDGDVDLMDIMTEVTFALGTAPDSCQCADLDAGPCTADVPTGTPGRAQECDGGIDGCCPPDGVINILDIMVLIDMALDRQDCCTYFYSGIIY
jgi:hypothetical protein